jgi:carbamoyltransferase
MKIVGFQSGHDVSYCILEDGIPIIHEEEERFTRAKMRIGDGLDFFFSRVSDYSDIKYFSLGNFGALGAKDHTIEGNPEKMYDILKQNDGEFHNLSHHTCHAANAFFTSNFKKSLIITIDGGGWEDYETPTAVCVFNGNENKIERVKLYGINELNFGHIWYRVTSNVFNLSVGYPKGDQSGTVMAMASMGEPKYTNLFNNTDADLLRLQQIINISEQEKFNVAASLQKHTEDLFREHLSEFLSNPDVENLCVSGGVSLNCVLMGKIKSWFPNIKNIFCDPVPYDSGLSLGSARYLWHHILENPRIYNNEKNTSPYLGVKYDEKTILNSLELFESIVNYETSTDEQVLDKLLDQKIISVFGGGSESGRRALGNRSILADPRNPEMKDIINHKVKHRQWYRPFAPSILQEKVNEWFDEYCESPYMSFALKFKNEVQDLVPAVVHYDGTGRIQTVTESSNKWYYNFIKKWENITNVPIILNTSFNDTEPIVETPTDAIKCFLNTNIDYLYFYDFGLLISKK